jgi:hypothetical protein
VTTLTLLPELTSGLSETLTRAIDSTRAQWTPEGAGQWVAGVTLLRSYVAATKGLAQKLLREGVDAREFVGLFGPMVPLLDRCLTGYSRLEGQGVMASAPAEVKTAFDAVRGEMAACRQFLSELLAKAAPPRLDWKRLKEESDADFAAGRFTAYETAEDVLKDLASGA